ncbi:hypothetical protein [Micromonospora sp. NPDC048839]|uniref:hypothetical protein n=1 Tax=Micromonospora sp. NPDC048839 TaxID=3155641 RepID=UPI0033E5BD49
MSTEPAFRPDPTPTRRAWRDPAEDDMDFWGLTLEQRIHHLKRLVSYGMWRVEQRMKRAAR